MSETVDSSLEAIAACVEWLREPGCGARKGDADGLKVVAGILAQVARERDEAVERITRWRAENGGRYWEARFRDEEIRADAAERQLAEARAALVETRKILKLLADFADDASRLDYKEDRVVTWIAIVVSEARALLSGETTRVEDEP